MDHTDKPLRINIPETEPVEAPRTIPSTQPREAPEVAPVETPTEEPVPA